jgi:hypothetical protein
MQEYFVDILDHDLTTVIQTVNPENLHLVLNDGEVSTIDFELTDTALDTSGNPVIQGFNYFSPWENGWRLRYGPFIVIASGLISSVNLAYGRPFLAISGVDWLGYLNRRFWPFDGRRPHWLDYCDTGHTPPLGFSYSDHADVADILTTMLDIVLARPNSVPLTYTLAPTGIVKNFQLSLADNTKILDIVKNVCSLGAGTAFEITHDRIFRIATPTWYGDPDAIANNPADGNLIYTFDDAGPPLQLDFTNSGPAETHIQGEGDGTTGRNVVCKGNIENQEVFWRLDEAYQFDDAITRTQTDDRVEEKFAFDLNPIHQIPLVADPHVVDTIISDGYFWTNFKPGRAIWIDLVLGNGFHHIQSAHHIAAMDCQFDNQGGCRVSIQQNQIYDTSGEAFVDEG